MKTLLLLLLFSAICVLNAQDPDPTIAKRLRIVDVNKNTFSIQILKNGQTEHEKVGFTPEQFTALTKSIYRARPPARMSFITNDGASFSIYHPSVKTVKEIGF